MAEVEPAVTDKNGRRIHTKCWDCVKATTGECCWSAKQEPVDGWCAIKTEQRFGESYIVIDCPQFRRDAWDFGMKRMPKVKHER
jgi:hypothetical protein